MECGTTGQNAQAHLPCPGQHGLQVVTEALEAPQAQGQAVPVLQQPLQLPVQTDSLGTLLCRLCPLLVCVLQRLLLPCQQTLWHRDRVSRALMPAPAQPLPQHLEEGIVFESNILVLLLPLAQLLPALCQLLHPLLKLLQDHSVLRASPQDSAPEGGTAASL